MDDDSWRQQQEEEEQRELIEWHEQQGANHDGQENRVATAARTLPGASDQHFAEAVQAGFTEG